MGVEGLYRGRTLSPRGAAADPPIAPWGATAPSPPSPAPRPLGDLFVNFFYKTGLSPPAWATGGLSPSPWATGVHFWKFLERPYMFEILFF